MILTSDQEVLQESTLIIEWFEQRYTEKSDIPCEPRLQYLMWLLEDFTDEYMPRIHMHMLWDNQQNKRTVSHRLGRAYCYAKEDIAVQDIATMFASRQPNVDKHLGSSDEVRANMDKQIIDLLNILEEHFCIISFCWALSPRWLTLPSAVVCKFSFIITPVQTKPWRSMGRKAEAKVMVLA